MYNQMMAFEKMRAQGKARPGMCGLCGKAPKAGSVKVVLFDDASKVVASKSVQVCEACGERAYADMAERVT